MEKRKLWEILRMFHFDTYYSLDTKDLNHCRYIIYIIKFLKLFYININFFEKFNCLQKIFFTLFKTFKNFHFPLKWWIDMIE